MSGPPQTYGVSVFIDPMLEELGWSRSLVSASYSVATILAGTSMLVFGRYLDRLGARRVVTVPAFLYGAACLGMASVTSPIGLAIGFTSLRVLGSAALVLSCTTLASLWFVRWRGRATSITVLGMALSNAVMPIVLQTLVLCARRRTGRATDRTARFGEHPPGHHAPCQKGHVRLHSTPVPPRMGGLLFESMGQSIEAWKRQRPAA